ncbi:unnamed protein product, partial [Mesorhabditis belari]|uniref:Signal recognition particle receptor subunit beta n=1 Tax=Mesorhabditis belari TaxID=2138241 RepID=A0AAF3EYN4_9BILA
MAELVANMDVSLLAIAVAIVVVIASVLFFVLRSLGKSPTTVLICGLSDAGKSQIYARLGNKEAEVLTYTSMAENSFEWKLGKRLLRIVDFPGAERLRKNLIEKYLTKERSSLRGIVFVVDSATFGKRSRDVAEMLYDVALESETKVPILVTCNKQDIGLAKSAEAIRSSLEREIGLINRSRSAALTTTDGTNQIRTLGDSGSEFAWDDLPIEVDFVESSVAPDSIGLDSVRQWIKK